ncbi:MAG TPA: SsrA-binding protein SmpB [Elusimicrobiales bacterium]|nr:SsrA-binding protein SmpB [Elusimicrobiales bacterium]
MSKTEKQEIVHVASNRKALHDYHITDTYEAGLCLTGPEVKSLRERQVSMEQSFARLNGGEAFILNLNIKPYRFDHVTTTLEPARTRKLLLKASELKKLIGRVAIKGNSLIPLEIYFKRGWAKVKLGLAEGKKAADKRDSIKKKDLEREVRREFKSSFRG